MSKKQINKFKKYFLSDSAIWIYTIIYFILATIKFFDRAKENFFVFIGVIFLTFIFYRGIKAIIKKRMGIWMGYLKGRDAVIYGVFGVVVAILFLIFV